MNPDLILIYKYILDTRMIVRCYKHLGNYFISFQIPNTQITFWEARLDPWQK